MKTFYPLLSVGLLALGFSVVVFGAYVRLSNAGLGCPDWPGCYGHLIVPPHGEARVNEHLRPFEAGKAWREMIHRYLASALGFGIMVLALLAWRRREPGAPARGIALLLVPLVIAQGILGMWTVTWLLKPLVVTAHLIGGFLTLALLWWHWLDQDLRRRARTAMGSMRAAAILVLAVFAVQVFLGGWTSANYAALACTDFPTCQGELWPQMDFNAAFVLWRGLGIDYEFGVLETPARTAIHVTHRLWAVVTALAVLALALTAIRRSAGAGRRAGWCIIAALCVQLILGISNVLFGLPLPVAVAHNAVAAVLMLALVSLLHHLNTHEH